MQYSMGWDPAILQFKNIQNFGLPYLGDENFGTHITDQGTITSVWIDNSLKGVSLNDGNAIFQVCFDVVGDAGQSSPFTFKEDPTPFEVVTAKEEVISINGIDGLVRVEN